MAHSVSPEAEAILDKEFPVLDKGFVRLVDYMGGDNRIVQAARVSYGEGTKTFREDKGLVTYLLRNDHTSPFEQVVLTFHLKMPIFVARQLVRHRTARLNEISGRYSIMKEDFYLPSDTDIAFQSTDNKQGRSTEPVPETLKQEVLNSLKQDQKQVYGNYTALVNKCIAKELARVNLPLSVYTEMYWQMDLHNLFHFIRLRIHPHAQKEIQEYARVLLEITSKVAPMACEAFENHIRGSVRFSKKEVAALKALLEGSENPLKGRDLEIFNQKLGKE